MSIDNTTQDAALRQLALGRLKKQAEFKLHAMIYVLVNGFLVVIWWMTGVPFFWPVFPIFGWGIGVAANWWDAYIRAVPTEEEIRAEMLRLRDRGAVPD
jgi:2TM domain-containing protein